VNGLSLPGTMLKAPSDQKSVAQGPHVNESTAVAAAVGAPPNSASGGGTGTGTGSDAGDGARDVGSGGIGVRGGGSDSRAGATVDVVPTPATAASATAGAQTRQVRRSRKVPKPALPSSLWDASFASLQRYLSQGHAGSFPLHVSANVRIAVNSSPSLPARCLFAVLWSTILVAFPCSTCTALCCHDRVAVPSQVDPELQVWVFKQFTVRFASLSLFFP